MAEYTSTREGFERAMKWSLTGPPEEAKEYAEALSTPNFWHVNNGQRLEYDAYIAMVQEWRGKGKKDYQCKMCVTFLL